MYVSARNLDIEGRAIIEIIFSHIYDSGVKLLPIRSKKEVNSKNGTKTNAQIGSHPSIPSIHGLI